MSDYDNENRGAIWRNEKKEKDTHPDFTGSLNVGGTEFWVSAWKRKEGAGPKSPALSFSVKPKEETPAGDGRRTAGNAAPPKSDPFPDEDIPF